MKSILVGSNALKYWFEGDAYLTKRGQDLDYWSDGPVASKHRGEEYHDVSQYAGLMTFLGSCNYHLTRDIYLPTPEQLYTLKVSHSFWDIFWPKTVSDIRFFQEKGIKFDEDLFKVLYADWEKIHGKKRAYLKRTKAEFFNDNVKRKYQHDDIHSAIMYNSEPMYKKILKDGEEVLTDRKKFAMLSHDDKLKTAREEIYVTSLERFLIPSDFKENPLVAYRKACQLVCTSMTSGYFSLFIILNWKVLNVPDVRYDEKFKERINRVRVSC